MWLLVLFDLPTKTREEKAAASGYRKDLRVLGFGRMQWSVYARHQETREKLEGIARDAQRAMPEKGKVSFLVLTDAQHESIENFRNKVGFRAERRPKLLCF